MAAFALMLCVYAPALSNQQGEEIYEDTNFNAVFFWPTIDTVSIMQPRALMGFSFALFPRVPYGHLVNVGLHGLSGFLLWIILRRVATEWSAVVWTAVFWLHPIQVEAVAYLAGRGELLTTLCVLGMVWAFLSLRSDLGASLVIGVMGLLALVAKQTTGISVFLWLPVLAWCFGRGRRTVLPLVAWSALFMGGIMNAAWPGFADLAWIARQASAAWHLVRLVLIPLGQSIETPPPFVPWVALTSLVLITVLLLRAAPSWRLVGLWAVIGFLPRLVIAQVTGPEPEPLHEHHLYAITVGLCLGLSSLWPRA